MNRDLNHPEVRLCPCGNYFPDWEGGGVCSRCRQEAEDARRARLVVVCFVIGLAAGAVLVFLG